MISESIRAMLEENYDHDYMIVGDNVAHVMGDNTALHATIILTSIGYSSIPVLNTEGQFLGTVSLSGIMHEAFRESGIDVSRLQELKVSDVMVADTVILREGYTIEEMLHKLVNHNYLPVVSESQMFIGIVTRKEVLKAINYTAHDFDKFFEVKRRNLDLKK